MAWYILDNNHKPVAKPVLESVNWMEDNPKRKTVGYDELKDLNGDDIRVSTVFLGLDHAMPWEKDKTPVLWETMIFGGPNDQEYQERYTSYEDAVEGHKVAVQIAINSLKTENNGEIE
jgi:hypothetical protein